MNLFEIKNFSLTFAPQALALEPFYELWKRDKSKEKEVAVMELSYIYFFTDYKSDFSDVLDEKERTKEIKKVLRIRNWNPDKKVKEAIKFYKERQQTVSTKLLDDARNAVSKISSFLKDVDLNLIDDKGRPIHDSKKIADTVGVLSKMIASLNDLEDQVKKEQEKKGLLRAGREKGIFEDE